MSTPVEGTLGRKVTDFCPLSHHFVAEANKFRDLVGAASTILISSTLTSDGDSIGGQIGLASLARLLNPKVKITIVNESEVPHRYSFLKGTSEITDFASWSGDKKWDLGIVCDGGVERTGIVAELFSGVDKRILVDHHAVGSGLAYDAKLLELDVSSTCELVFHLFQHCGQIITPEVAEALYVGIVFDTGFFKHNLTKPRTHLVASHLIATGIDFSAISDEAILERTWEAQRLLKQLLDNMTLSPCDRVITSYWSKQNLDEIKPQDGDQEGMINQLYFTAGVQVVALFTEVEENDIKVSFRSKGQLNVADFARSLNPEGGGHIRASGCALTGSLESVREEVTRKLVEALNQKT